jgi:hypothetical protein
MGRTSRRGGDHEIARRLRAGGGTMGTKSGDACVACALPD